jgi:hypothetical protein
VKDMEEIKVIPKSCTECDYTSSCDSYYGGANCEYEKEINTSVFERFWAQFEKED